MPATTHKGVLQIDVGVQNRIQCNTRCYGSKPCYNKLKQDKNMIAMYVHS